MGKIFETDTGRFERVSRWLSRRRDYDITSRHSLFCYAQADGFGGWYVDYVLYKHRKHAVAAFYWLSGLCVSGDTIEYKEGGKMGVISALDMDSDMHSPLYVEVDEEGDCFRFYRKVVSKV